MTGGVGGSTPDDRCACLCVTQDNGFLKTVSLLVLVIKTHLLYMSATKLETEDVYRSSAYVDYARIYSLKNILFLVRTPKIRGYPGYILDYCTPRYKKNNILNFVSEF